MPTGYTAALHDGKPQTFQQFALDCSRVMGAAIMQRGEDPSARIRFREVDDYYRESVEKAKAALYEAEQRTDAEWERLEVQEREQANALRAERVRDRAAVRDRYQTMLDQVAAWSPPTSEHQGLKDFMESQLRESIQFDCTPLKDYDEPIAPRTVAVFKAEKLASLRRTLAYASESLAEQERIAASQRAWVEALFESLGVSA